MTNLETARFFLYRTFRLAPSRSSAAQVITELSLLISATPAPAGVHALEHVDVKVLHALAAGLACDQPSAFAQIGR
jgi:hypothetical protein